MLKPFALLVYCLPPLLTLTVILYSYRERTTLAAVRLAEIAQHVYVADHQDTSGPQAEGSGDGEALRAILNDKDGAEILDQVHRYFTVQKSLNVAQPEVSDIQPVLDRIWARNATIVSIMTLLPFVLLGHRLAFHAQLTLTDKQRVSYASRNWGMKFLVAFVIGTGWMYVVNPLGRGTTTAQEFLISRNLLASSSVPIFISTKSVVHTVAGFLGWYLYLMTYFFRKLYYNDVVSGRVYRFLFGKFLFTFGIALVATSALGDQATIALFLIGYFPLEAFSLLKEYGVKATDSEGAKGSALANLPGISRWQILRLEEEGIDSLSALAVAVRGELETSLPLLWKPLIGMWMDISRLTTVVGHEAYENLKPICRTASDFVAHVDDDEFLTELKAAGINNVREITRLLSEEFGVRPARQPQ